MTLATIADAIEWAESRWDGQRTAPLRLHLAHFTDGALGAPAFTHSFAATLDVYTDDAGNPAETTSAARTVSCYHPMLARGKTPYDCPECQGIGVKDVNVDRYRYPMTLALTRLARVVRPRRQPHPSRLVLVLAEHGWDWRAASRAIGVYPDMGEALMLQALRQLYGRYEEGPVRISWIAKSESQQHAEQLAS